MNTRKVKWKYKLYDFRLIEKQGVVTNSKKWYIQKKIKFIGLVWRLLKDEKSEKPYEFESKPSAMVMYKKLVEKNLIITRIRLL